MRKAKQGAAALLLWAASAFGHEHWIVTDVSGTAGNGLARIRICSGHNFPQSDLLLAERLLSETVVVGPDGKSVLYKPHPRDKTWTADVAFDKPGVWMVSFALKKPQESDPLFRGRSLLVLGPLDDPSRYAQKKGLEIVPGAALSTLKIGDTLPVSILVDGSPVEGKIAITPEKGSVSFLSTAKDRPAQLKIAAYGACLLTVSHKGRTFALTFTIADPSQGTAP